MLCSFVHYLEAVTVHLYKKHLNVAAPLQCSCGFIADREKCLERHMRKRGYAEQEPQPSEPVPTHLMIREATQEERRRQHIRKAPVAQPFILTEERLDYQDWDEVETDPSETWEELRKKQQRLEEENGNLKKEVDRLKEINEVISAEILEPDVGVPYEYALSGFESDWAEQTRNMASSTLFPDPPKKLASTVTVPETNRHLSKNQRVWKRCSQEAIKKYNKKHQH